MNANHRELMDYVALSRRVLAVAAQGSIGDWAAYIDAVEGENHEEEMQRVADHGTKLPYGIAKILFPHWAKKFGWRE